MRIGHWLCALLAEIRQRFFSFRINRRLRKKLLPTIRKSSAIFAATIVLASPCDISADDPSFFPARNFPTGSGPHDVDVADFNGDGFDDVVTGNWIDGDITVLLGQENGVLGEPIISTGFSGFGQILAGDFTGDGLQDLVLSRSSIPQIRLLQGNGDGSLQLIQSLNTPEPPFVFLTADFDNNGLPDVVFRNGSERKISVSLNSKGSLSDLISTDLEGIPRGATSQDFDGDGITDLAVRAYDPTRIEILLGNGNGTFTSGQMLNATAFGHLVVGDFDGDDIADLVLFDEVSKFHRGNGDGSFQPDSFIPELSLPINQFTSDVVVGDFNGDGLDDIATSNSLYYDTTVHVNDGNATFQPIQEYAAGLRPEALQIGDVNGDGVTDVTTANSRASHVTTLIGKGDGTFEANASIELDLNTNGRLVDAKRADLNGDDRNDLVVPVGDDDLIAIAISSGDAQFAPTEFVPVGHGPVSVAIDDYNGDGIMDIASANRFSDDVSILLGLGDGTFQKQTRLVVSDSPETIVAGEFNGDEFVDLATVNGDGSISVLLGFGDGSFAKQIQTETGTGEAAQAGDFDGDGLTDIAIQQYDGILILLASGDGTFESSDTIDHPFNIISFTVGDVDDDGVLDLVAGKWWEVELAVSYGNGDGSFTIQDTLVAEQMNSAQKVMNWIAVGDFNNDDVSDIAVTVEYQGSAGFIAAGSLAIVPGNGNREFRPFQLFDVNSVPLSLVTGDFNQDGADDLLIPTLFDEAQVFLNRQQILLGDVNRDCAVNLLDKEPFVQVLASGVYQVEADINQDGQVTLLDVQPFVDLLLD